MVELERRGIPTVLFTAQTFVHDAHRSAASFGLAGLPLAVVPLPFTNQTPADIHGMAERAFDQVRAGLTRPVEAPKAVERPRSTSGSATTAMTFSTRGGGCRPTSSCGAGPTGSRSSPRPSAPWARCSGRPVAALAT